MANEADQVKRAKASLALGFITHTAIKHGVAKARAWTPSYMKQVEKRASKLQGYRQVILEGMAAT